MAGLDDSDSCSSYSSGFSTDDNRDTTQVQSGSSRRTSTNTAPIPTSSTSSSGKRGRSSRGSQSKRTRVSEGEEGDTVWREHHNQQERRRRDTLGGEFIKMARIFGVPVNSSRVAILQKAREKLMRSRELDAIIEDYDRMEEEAETDKKRGLTDSPAIRKFDSIVFEEDILPFIQRQLGLDHKRMPLEAWFQYTDEVDACEQRGMSPVDIQLTVLNKYRALYPEREDEDDKSDDGDEQKSEVANASHVKPNDDEVPIEELGGMTRTEYEFYRQFTVKRCMKFGVSLSEEEIKQATISCKLKIDAEFLERSEEEEDEEEEEGEEEEEEGEEEEEEEGEEIEEEEEEEEEGEEEAEADSEEDEGVEDEFENGEYDDQEREGDDEEDDEEQNEEVDECDNDFEILDDPDSPVLIEEDEAKYDYVKETVYENEDDFEVFKDEYGAAAETEMVGGVDPGDDDDVHLQLDYGL